MKYKFSKIIASLSTLLIAICTNTVAYAAGVIKPETNEKIKAFAETVNEYSTILIAFALSTSVLIFIIHFIRLANSYDHPFMRRQVQKDIFITGIAVALIGAIGLISKVISATVL